MYIFYYLIIYLINYLITPWNRVLFEKLAGTHLVKKFPAFHWARRFIIAFTCDRHLSLSWAGSILSMFSHPTSWKSILILSSHVRLGLLSDLSSSGFPTKTLYPPFLSPIRVTFSTYLFLLDLITRIMFGDEFSSLSFSIWSFLHSPVTSSPLSPNLLLNTLFSNIPSISIFSFVLYIFYLPFLHIILIIWRYRAGFCTKYIQTFTRLRWNFLHSHSVYFTWFWTQPIQNYSELPLDIFTYVNIPVENLYHVKVINCCY